MNLAVAVAPLTYTRMFMMNLTNISVATVHVE